MSGRYDALNPILTPFHASRAAFKEGADSPRAFLERGLEVMEAREAEIQAFTAVDLEGARNAADAATERYRAGRPLSVLDGCPIGVKDIIDTAGMPTGHGSPIFAKNRPEWDAACVYWLKKAGAVIVGKTVTAEFATRPPGATRNPWDLNRTPGGSSSGSGAAVGAGMLPLALGTQVRGSVLRPAAYCGAYGLKPSYGVITLQGLHPLSADINHLGTLGASLEDAWLGAHLMSRLAGGQPNTPPLEGATEMPPPQPIRSLIRLETEGWDRTEERVREPFEKLMAALAASGVEVISRNDDPEIEAVEQMFSESLEVIERLSDWEGRYPMLYYHETHPELLSEFARNGMARHENIDPETYALALLRADAMRTQFAALAARADACATLSATGPAPEGMETGDTIFNNPFSLLHVPTLTLPVFELDGLPMGLQLVGFFREDRTLVAQGQWLDAFARKAARA